MSDRANRMADQLWPAVRDECLEDAIPSDMKLSAPYWRNKKKKTRKTERKGKNGPTRTTDEDMHNENSMYNDESQRAGTQRQPRVPYMYCASEVVTSRRGCFIAKPFSAIIMMMMIMMIAVESTHYA